MINIGEHSQRELSDIKMFNDNYISNAVKTAIRAVSREKKNDAVIKDTRKHDSNSHRRCFERRLRRLIYGGSNAFSRNVVIETWSVGDKQHNTLSKNLSISGNNMVRSENIAGSSLQSEVVVPNKPDLLPYCYVMPLRLAAAGFFSTDVGDEVTRFSCCVKYTKRTLRDKQKEVNVRILPKCSLSGEDCLTEHARWFSKVEFVVQNRGRQLVEMITRTKAEMQVLSSVNFSEKPQNAFSTQNNTTARQNDTSLRHTDILRGNYASSQTDIRSVQEENSQLKEQMMCKICMDNNLSIVFLPCGHLICCIDCAKDMKNCPMCRVAITGTVKTYLP